MFPNEAITPEGETDIVTTTKLLKSLDDNYEMTDAGGNDNAVFRLIKAVAGSYNTLTFVSSGILQYIV